jgi:hypothetical protein
VPTSETRTVPSRSTPPFSSIEVVLHLGERRPPFRASARRTRIPSGARGGVAAMTMSDAPLELLSLVVQVPRRLAVGRAAATTRANPTAVRRRRRRRRRRQQQQQPPQPFGQAHAAPRRQLPRGPRRSCSAHHPEEAALVAPVVLCPNNMPYESISLCLHVRAEPVSFLEPWLGVPTIPTPPCAAEQMRMRRPPLLLLLSAIDPSLFWWKAAGGTTILAREGRQS